MGKLSTDALQGLAARNIPQIKKDVRRALELPDDAVVDVELGDKDGDGLLEISIYVEIGAMRIKVLDVELKGSVREVIQGLLQGWRERWRTKEEAEAQVPPEEGEPREPRPAPKPVPSSDPEEG